MEKVWKEKLCKKTFFINKEVGIDFEGSGYSFQTNKDYSKMDKIEVKYRGTFGKSDFEVVLK